MRETPFPPFPLIIFGAKISRSHQAQAQHARNGCANVRQYLHLPLYVHPHLYIM